MKVHALVLSSLLLFCAIFTLDFLTPQRLVVAILLNIPIALSGLTLKRRFIVGMVLAALTANAFVGWHNATTEGGLDSNSLLAASFLLVGVMTIQLTQFSSRLELAKLEEQRLRRERDRERLMAIGQASSVESAIQQAAQVLCECCEARAAVLCSSNLTTFAAPRASFPSSLTAWAIGATLPQQLHGAPPLEPLQTDNPAQYALSANHATLAGFEWAGHAPMLLALLEPQHTEHLRDLLPTLRAALERAELTERLAKNRHELERRSEVIRDLVYAFSHDLRTPLVANGVNMRLALEGAFGELPADYCRTLQNGIEANEDLLGLADSLLLVAKFESDISPVSPVPVDLENAARSSAARLPHRQFAWQVAGQPEVLGSPADLRRVVQNLLENAAKYSPENAPIEVLLRADHDTVRLEVADRGQGVPTELEPRLFLRFSSGKVGGGTGLGLYLAKRICQAHGGRIGYHPRVGGGSVFWLEFPKAVA
jgi:signal transduction histidine kinase